MLGLCFTQRVDSASKEGNCCANPPKYGHGPGIQIAEAQRTIQVPCHIQGNEAGLRLKETVQTVQRTSAQELASEH